MSANIDPQLMHHGVTNIQIFHKNAKEVCRRPTTSAPVHLLINRNQKWPPPSLVSNWSSLSNNTNLSISGLLGDRLSSIPFHLPPF